MNDKQIRETLGRISNVFEMDFVMSGDESPHRKALRALAERQAAMEEITRLKRRYAVGQTTGERAREIACRFTGGE